MVAGFKVNWNEPKKVLPPQGVNVLCVGLRDGIFIAKCVNYDGDIYWTDSCGIPKKVVYWVALPLTPKQERLLEENK